MKRVLIKDIAEYDGKEVAVRGRIINIRKLGNLNFIILQDYTGTIQTVTEKLHDIATGDVAEIEGKVRKDERAMGGYESKVMKLSVISKSEDLPIDLAKPEPNFQLNTLLDLRPLTLRHPKIQAIFKLYDILLESYEEIMRDKGFTEIKTPKILETATESGAGLFEIQYFDKKAYLAQSPQLYKQIMVGVFERVFEIGPVFRAEPHFTTRHVNEYISLDAELGFITDYKDVTAELNQIFAEIFAHLKEKGQPYLEMLDIKLPEVPKE